MASGLFKLDWASVFDSLITAVATAVVVGLYGVFTTSGFHVLSADWWSIGGNVLDWASMAAVLSLYKDFVSDSQGNVLGIKTN